MMCKTVEPVYVYVYMRNKLTQSSRGFTLVEMLVSMGIMSILVLSLGSVLLIATHAIPESNVLESRLYDAYQVTEDLSSELQFAVNFTERSTNAITFTVADRDTDSTPETIRYAWSGVPGDPLTRQYNSDPPVSVLTDVNQFQMNYLTDSETAGSSPSSSTSDEMLLEEYIAPLTPSDYSLKDRNWIGQTVMPDLPADANSWSITRIRIYARSSGNTNGVTSVQLRYLQSMILTPYSTILAQSPMYESSLAGTYSWQEFSFSNVTGIDPAQDLCIVLASQVKDTVLAEIQYDDAGGFGRLISSNKGSSWSVETTRSMVYQVYGTVTTASTVPDTITYLKGVAVKIDYGADAIETQVQILNAPEVTNP